MIGRLTVFVASAIPGKVSSHCIGDAPVRNQVDWNQFFRLRSRRVWIHFMGLWSRCSLVRRPYGMARLERSAPSHSGTPDLRPRLPCTHCSPAAAASSHAQFTGLEISGSAVGNAASSPVSLTTPAGFRLMSSICTRVCILREGIPVPGCCSRSGDRRRFPFHVKCRRPARKSLARVSSSRHLRSLPCLSRDDGLGPVSARVRVSGSSLMHATPASEREDCRDSESWSRTGASLPSGVWVGVSSSGTGKWLASPSVRPLGSPLQSVLVLLLASPLLSVSLLLPGPVLVPSRLQWLPVR